jgi:hypothetical protein
MDALLGFICFVVLMYWLFYDFGKTLEYRQREKEFWCRWRRMEKGWPPKEPQLSRKQQEAERAALAIKLAESNARLEQHRAVQEAEQAVARAVQEEARAHLKSGFVYNSETLEYVNPAGVTVKSGFVYNTVRHAWETR